MGLQKIKNDRLEKLKQLKKLGVNPYPSKIEIEGERVYISEARKKLEKTVLVAGRIWALRGHGGATFLDVKDSSGQIQALFQEKVLEDAYKKIFPLLDTGDFIAVEGEVIKTQAGEITVSVSEFQLLSKSVRTLPSKWYGLSDVEERFRKRYLDLLLNPEVKERFDTRTQLVREVRRYLDNLGFMEVETPVLQSLYGGANAKPFKTHINALDEDMYLRIADELYLKRLLVGGYEKIYEICKDFRNEGMDLSHNPEFTMIEYYEAYADYHRVMDVTEGLFKHLAQSLFGKMELRVGEKIIDISKKWPRVTMKSIIKEKLKLDVEKETKESLGKYCKNNGVETVGGETKGQLIYAVFEHRVTDTLISPVWIIDYPTDVSPLSKGSSKDSELAERFEGYIGGREICDGWSELNDPKIQRERFESDVKAARKDKEEAQQVDEDFIESMEYGMPPIGGIGIGIDRLTMFFTNTWSIKEVILYPTMRSEKHQMPEEQGYDYRGKKMVAVLDRDLLKGLATNALGHLAFSAGHYSDSSWMGEEKLVDANGSIHVGISRYPFITLRANKEEIKKIVIKAKEIGVFVVDYPQEMFDTGRDEDLAKAISKAKEGGIEYHAVVLVGQTGEVNKLTAGLELYK